MMKRISIVVALLAALIVPAPAPAAVSYPLVAVNSATNLGVIVQIAIAGHAGLRTWCVGNDSTRRVTLFPAPITAVYVYPRVTPTACGMGAAGALMRQFTNLPLTRNGWHLTVTGASPTWTVNLN
jgi:hypothetical protein